MSLQIVGKGFSLFKEERKHARTEKKKDTEVLSIFYPLQREPHPPKTKVLFFTFASPFSWATLHGDIVFALVFV